MYLPEQAGADRWNKYPAAVPADPYDSLGDDCSPADECKRADYRIEQFLEACEECGLWEEEHVCGRTNR